MSCLALCLDGCLAAFTWPALLLWPCPSTPYSHGLFWSCVLFWLRLFKCLVLICSCLHRLCPMTLPGLYIFGLVLFGHLLLWPRSFVTLSCNRSTTLIEIYDSLNSKQMAIQRLFIVHAVETGIYSYIHIQAHIKTHTQIHRHSSNYTCVHT